MAKIVILFALAMVTASSSSSSFDDNPTLNANKIEEPEHQEQIVEQTYLFRQARAITCPRHCTCEDHPTSDSSSVSSSQILSPLPLPTVTCSKQNLTSVPPGIPGDTKKLDLSWNNISKIQQHQTNNNLLGHLFKLQELSLKGNELEDLEPSAFSNLTRLKELTLSKNRLTSVPVSEALPQSLEILDLEHNRIARVEGRVLTRNGRIRALRLGHNLIEHIAPDAFQFLTSLTILELNDNKLTEVPSEALKRLPALQELTLANNRIIQIDVPFHLILPRIVLLQVKDNPIQAIHPDGFSHLHHLKKLILSAVSNLTFPHLNGTSSLEILRIDRCGLESVPDNLCDFTPSLKSLDLKSNKLQRLPSLSQCTELRVLDLNSNEIEEIEEDSMANLSQLHDLHMQKNKIARIDSHTFRGLSNLRVLDLSRNRIEHIDAGAFLHVRNLQDLNLHDNLFPTLPPAGLDRLVDLKTHNNPNLKEFPGPEHFPSVRRLYLSYAYHCCQFMGSRGNLPALVPAQQPQVPETDINDKILYPTDNEFGKALDALNLSSMWTGIVNLSNRAELANDFWNNFETDMPTGSSFPEDGGASDDIFVTRYRPPRPNEITCIPQPGPFLPCTDLFDWWTLRCGVWIVFLLALMGNGTVVFVLIFARTKMDVPRFLVCNLAVADFFMGVYLGFLAVVDAATLGEFRRFAIQWQLSSACQTAGFMGVLSSELSVFTLAVITMERHYAITHAMHLNKRLSLRHASYIMVVGWIFALIMAILPLFGASDYRKFAVCLPFETENSASKGYVVFLMFANGVAFTILMGCYLKMYCSIRGSQAWNSNDTRIAKRMALLVFTDLLCWFPIAFFSLTAIFGLQLVSLEEAKVFTVFVLPLNSCCNPFLYAILTKQFKKDCVMICKAIEESRVTRGIGRCRHSSNFSNRQTAPNTGSLTEKSSKDGQPCICHSGLHPGKGGDVNGNAKHRFIKSPAEGLRAMGPVGRFFSRYVLCQDPNKDNRKRDEDYRMRNVRRYLYSQPTNYVPDAGDGKHQRHASVSSDNFSSSRSDSWRVQNRCGIPLRMIEPRRRNSWAVTRKPSQDSNLSSSRNDSSATSNSTATWRLSRSSVSSDAASHSGGGKSSFKRISSAGAGGPNSGGSTASAILRPSVLGGKNTLQTSQAAVAAAAAAAAVATGSAAGTDLQAITAVANNPALLGAAAVVAATNSEDEVAHLTRVNTIQNQHPLPMIPGPPPQTSRRSSMNAVQAAAPITKKVVSTKEPNSGITKKKKKKRVKIKKPPKASEITMIGKSSGSSGVHPEIDNDDEIDDEEASAKIATNRPRLVRQSAFFSEEVVIEPEICPVHGPLNPGTYDDEDDEDEDVSDLDDDDDDDEDDEDEEEADEENPVIAPEPASHHSIGSVIGRVICEEDEEEDIEDPTSPILRQTGGQTQMAGIALVIVPRRLSTVRSRDAVTEHEQTAFIRSSGSSSSINNQIGAGGGSPLSISPTAASFGGGQLSSPSMNTAASNLQQQHSSTNSPTALLLPAGMAHFGRRKMSEQPVKFYVVPATTGLLTSAKWHSMSHVDSSGGGTSPTASGSSPNQQRHHPQNHPHHHHHSPGQVSPNFPSSPTSLRSQQTQQHSRSHSPRQFPTHDNSRRLSSSIAETAEEMIPLSNPLEDDTIDDQSPSSSAGPHQRSPSVIQREALNERRVSFQLPGINLLAATASGAAAAQVTAPRSNSPPERISPPNSSSSRRTSNS